mmetsp:Transcript_74896/g.86955  ORF Transcript_74896/g.86955 Transcript_74896/m.86955 type:complete len:425 (+) Transcript_74896:82-1356(+)
MLRRFNLRLCSSAASAIPNHTQGGQLLEQVHVVECPRDAMQGLRDFVPTDEKARYINALLKVGFHTIDFGSFVSAPAVPQMRDTKDVLERLDLSQTTSKLLVVVANIKGAARASSFDAISSIGYPLSVSETFQKANTNRDVNTALEDLQHMQTLCVNAKKPKELVAFISMAFGNPYGEAYHTEKVEALVERVVNMGIRTVSLADTVGVSDAPTIRKLYASLIPRFPQVQFGAHFHSGTTSSALKVHTALDAGCRRFDGAIGGMGGCPFAKSTLVGNVATECIVDVVSRYGSSGKGIALTHGLDMNAFRQCEAIKHEIFGIAVKELLLARTLKNEREFTKLCFDHFYRYDRSGTGFMELKEFEQSVKDVFSELGASTPSTTKIQSSFQKLDANHVGAITVEQYMAGARRLLTKKLKELEADESSH